jgi:hypothetical protein
LDSDTAFRAQWTPAFKQHFGEDNSELAAAAKKYGFTGEQMMGYVSGHAPVPAGDRAKLTAMRKDLEANDGPFLAKWLKAIPD